MTALYICGRCGDLSPITETVCVCGCQLLLTVPDRVLARHVGSKDNARTGGAR